MITTLFFKDFYLQRLEFISTDIVNGVITSNTYLYIVRTDRWLLFKIKDVELLQLKARTIINSLRTFYWFLSFI